MTTKISNSELIRIQLDRRPPFLIISLPNDDTKTLGKHVVYMPIATRMDMTAVMIRKNMHTKVVTVFHSSYFMISERT